MEADVLPVVQPLQLVAHVLEQQPLLLGVHLQPTLEKAQNELDPPHGNGPSLVHINKVPGGLEKLY